MLQERLSESAHDDSRQGLDAKSHPVAHPVALCGLKPDCEAVMRAAFRKIDSEGRGKVCGGVGTGKGSAGCGGIWCE